MREHYDFSEAERGPVLKSRGKKERITIRLDKKILDWFKDSVESAGGGSYQKLINDALAEHINNKTGKDSFSENDKTKRLMKYIAASFLEQEEGAVIIKDISRELDDPKEGPHFLKLHERTVLFQILEIPDQEEKHSFTLLIRNADQNEIAKGIAQFSSDIQALESEKGGPKSG